MSNNYSPENRERQLYRDPSRAKIGGVCVGLADYFGLEVWVVRIIAVTLLLFIGFPIFIAYIIAYIILDPKPGTSKHDRHSGIRLKIKSSLSSSDKDYHSSNKNTATVKQVWKKGSVPSQTLKGLNKQFKSLEGRLQAMETYVTSKQFELRKEFQNLSS